METTISSARTGKVTTEAGSKAISAFWNDLDNSRFGYTPMILLVIGIMGGIAASFALHMNIWALFAVVFPTMVCFCFMLALMPMKVIIRTALLAVIIDLILVITGTFL